MVDEVPTAEEREAKVRIRQALADKAPIVVIAPFVVRKCCFSWYYRIWFASDAGMVYHSPFEPFPYVNTWCYGVRVIL